MKYVKIHIVLCLFLMSCTSNTIFEKPEDLISPSTMEDVLTEMFIATGAERVTNKFGKREENYFPIIFNKYKIDSAQFKRSNLYYTSQIDAYDAILKEVERRLKYKKDSISKITKQQDSINRIDTKLRSSIRANKDKVKSYNAILQHINKFKDSVLKSRDSLANTFTPLLTKSKKITQNHFQHLILQLGVYTDTIAFLEKSSVLKNEIEILQFFEEYLKDNNAKKEVVNQLKSRESNIKKINKKLKKDDVIHFPINTKKRDTLVSDSSYVKANIYVKTLNKFKKTSQHQKKVFEKEIKRKDSILKERLEENKF